MKKRFSHIVWLGAGTATEPAGLLDMAERATLIEAREIACLSLQQQYPQERVSIKQLLLTADGASIEFTEYNLAEYSAIQAISGLKELFPGLKAVNRERLNSIRINDVVSELALQDHNNLLVVDITDSNLTLLTSLQQSGQLNQFSEIRIQAGIRPLYIQAATTIEITAFLQQQGYLLVQTADRDPDLPWLSFSLNPLWQTLQNAQHNNDALDKELGAIKQQLAAMQQQTEHASKEATRQLDDIKSQLSEKNAANERLLLQLETTNLTAATEQTALNQQITDKNVALSNLNQQMDQLRLQIFALQQNAEVVSDFEQLKSDAQQLKIELASKAQQLATTEREQSQLISKLQTELDLAKKHSAARLDTISQLEKNNRALNETNIHLTKQQHALTQELLKAEVQIDIIRELFLTQ